MSSSHLFDLNFAEDTILLTIRKIKADFPPETYPSQVLSFCEQWLEGTTEFELQSSGSTGSPKKTNYNRQQMIASAEATGTYFGLKKEDQVFICLNTQYTGGKMMLVRALQLRLKARIVFPSQNPFLDIEPGVFYKLTALVPKQLYRLLQLPDVVEVFKSFQHVIIGGMAVNNLLINEIRQFASPLFYETFGMTETLSHIALKKLNIISENTCFEVLQGIEIRINKEQCLEIKGEITKNEWITTKDVVELIDSRHFIWKGRADNVINSGGIKFYPEETESLIAPLLKQWGYEGDFFIGSEPDPVLGNKMVLFLEGPPFETSSLILYLKNALPSYGAPKNGVFLPSFLRTETGKIKRVKAGS